MLDGLRRAIIAGLIAGLVAAPVWAHVAQPMRAAQFALAVQEPHQVTAADRDQARSPAEPDARDREQEKRDREQEARDREQEKKDREQERLDRVQEMYDDGREALDEGKYAKAEERFSNVVRENGQLVDGAMYWKAYTENQQGKREAALTTIAELKKKFPKEVSNQQMEERCRGTRDRNQEPLRTGS